MAKSTGQLVDAFENAHLPHKILWFQRQPEAVGESKHSSEPGLEDHELRVSHRALLRQSQADCIAS